MWLLVFVHSHLPVRKSKCRGGVVGLGVPANYVRAVVLLLLVNGVMTACEEEKGPESKGTAPTGINHDAGSGYDVREDYAALAERLCQGELSKGTSNGLEFEVEDIGVSMGTANAVLSVRGFVSNRLPERAQVFEMPGHQFTVICRQGKHLWHSRPSPAEAFTTHELASGESVEVAQELLVPNLEDGEIGLFVCIDTSDVTVYRCVAAFAVQF